MFPITILGGYAQKFCQKVKKRYFMGLNWLNLFQLYYNIFFRIWKSIITY
jgi:hypothetical protein